MVSRIHQFFKVPDRSYFAIVKREIHTTAVIAGFSERKIGEIDIVVSEICTNLVNHGGGGQILLKLIEEQDIQGVEIIAIDNGEGMSDVNRMMMDGVSTKNTLGQGLGAIKRLSDQFQVFSQKDWGTILLSRIFNERLPYKKAQVMIHSLLLPKPNETRCGDGVHTIVSNDKIKVLLGDGLGHGPHAETAILKAMEAFENCPSDKPAEILREMHNATKKTRGLVATVAVFDRKSKNWQMCGIGNIITRINSQEGYNAYMPYNGIVGMNIPNTLTERSFLYEPGQYVLMYSDGLKSRTENNRMLPLQRYDCSIMAAALYKDFARLTDDVSVVICKPNV